MKGANEASESSDSPLTFDPASHLLHYLIIIGQSYMLNTEERSE